MNERISDLYEIKIDDQNIPVQKCRVSAIPFNRIWPGNQRPLDQTEEAAFINCETPDFANFVIKPKHSFKRCVVRPLSKNVKIAFENNEIRFTVPPGQYTVELDGCHNALHLFVDKTNSIEKYRDAANIYFGPGLHELGKYALKSDTTVFIDRGAVVFGSFYGRGLKNINIVGYGILSGERFVRTESDEMVPCAGMGPDWPTGEIQIFDSGNINIEGVTFMDADFWTMTFCACENVIMDNIKHIGMWRYNSDGMNIICSKNFIIKNSFFRNFDDIIVPNGRIPWNKIATENILVENCVCWCDWGGTLEIGAITRVDEIRYITFRNCDLIHNSGGAMRVHNTQWAAVHDIHWENIRVEYSRDCQKPVYQDSDDMLFESVDCYLPPLFVITVTDQYYKKIDQRTGCNYDLYARGIHILAEDGLSMPPIEIYGQDKKHHSKNVYLENITFNGQRVCETKKLNVKLNEFTSQIYLDGNCVHGGGDIL